MILIAAAIKDHGGNAGGLRTLGDQLADRPGRLDVAAGLERIPQALIQRRGRRQGMAARIINELRINMFEAARNVQTRSLRRTAHLGAHAPMPLLAKQLLIFSVHVEFVSSRAGFPTQRTALRAGSSPARKELLYHNPGHGAISCRPCRPCRWLCPPCGERPRPCSECLCPYRAPAS